MKPCAVERDLATHQRKVDADDERQASAEAKGDEIADEYKQGQRSIDADIELASDIGEALTLDNIASLVYDLNPRARWALRMLLDTKISERAKELAPSEIGGDTERWPLGR